jgi:hypothetical protein
MKRTLLDITKKISRSIGHAILTPIDMNNSTYWIFEATGWRFASILREIEYRTEQDRLLVYLNTQQISARDFVVEEGTNGILIKFIKSNFEFQLDNKDYIEIKGDIEQYA